MTFTEQKINIFKIPADYYLAHCISGDYTLGAGLAKQMDIEYDMRFHLFMKYPIPNGQKFANVGKALLIDNVFNLVNKMQCSSKADYNTLEETLKDMKQQCLNLGITKLAMSRLACGRDKLDWNNVSQMIQDIFNDTDIEIIACDM